MSRIVYKEAVRGKSGFLVKNLSVRKGSARRQRFSGRHRYALCCAMTSFASLLGFVNPVLSSFIVKNIVTNFNLRGIIPTLISMAAVKGTRMFLRSRVALQLKNSSSRAPFVWLRRRISKKLWWLEPMVNNWGWVGMVMTKLTGGVTAQIASFIVSMLTDTVNALLSGMVYYFTRSYVLSLSTALVIPSLAVVPWFAKRTLHIRRSTGAVTR